MSFVHLHTHSEYSLLDGANRIPDLIQRIQHLGMDSLAVTDHGNLHAAWTFYEQSRAAGIRPILGFEAYLAFGSRHARERQPDAPGNYSHLVLLAKNRTGYQNLIKLSSIGFVEGYYRRPRIDKEVLERHSEGIVCLAACLSGEIALWLRQENYDKARASAEWFAKQFGPDGFWLEVQDHGIADEKLVTQGMFKLADDLGLPVVATNDAHYLRREDAEAHDVLLAIGTGKDLDDPNRFRFTGSESYVKTEDEMVALFPDRPDVIANTQRVADLCEIEFERKYYVPEFPRPAEFASENDLLVHIAKEGLRRRYETITPQIQERLDYELGVITSCGYAGYFLIVQDFIRAAREKGIPVGPGRGSAAGSIVAYALGITDVDPLTFDLLFERFLNPERVSMPDIDVDFCFERRNEVIDYVRELYGRDSVGQIITFGTLKARASVRDVARVLRMPPSEADQIAKLIPSGPAVALTLADAAESVPELVDLRKSNPNGSRLLDLSQRIEGLSRHSSVHAAGVVIAPGPLDDYVPVCTAPQQRAAKNGEADGIITQYDMNALERAGMLKIDFLGLKTLTVIHDAAAMIQRRHDVTIDWDHIDLDDPTVYAMLQAGDTAGVFQFESHLGTDMLRQLEADRFDDLVATNALVRPGPLDSGMHLAYIRRKKGEEAVSYPHPELEPVLRATYGVIVYQEQVMRIANVLAGYSLGEADVLRKAVGKKDAELIRKELGTFVDRAVERGHDRPIIESIASQIETFGRYGFNKSHSVAYSVISFQTAWIKAYYPAEFMAALLSSEIGNTDKVVQYINASRGMNIEVLPPSVNESGHKFTVTDGNKIRFGLGAVRNVGTGAIHSIIASREAEGPFESLYDFCERIDLRLCNKRVLEALVAAGALDFTGEHRAQLAAGLETAFREAQLKQADREAGQGSLFGEATATAPAETTPQLPDVEPWTESDRLWREKEVLGFFISGHPLEKFRDEVQLFSSRTTATLSVWSEHPVQIGVVTTAVNRRISRKTGSEYARLILEDFHGTAEAIVFPDAWGKLSDIIVPDAALLLSGGYSPRDRGEDRAPFIIEQASPLADLKMMGKLAVTIRLMGEGMDQHTARGVAALCTAHPGPSPVLVEWSDGNGTRATLRSRRLRVSLDEHFMTALRDLVGTDRVTLEKAK